MRFSLFRNLSALALGALSLSNLALAAPTQAAPASKREDHTRLVYEFPDGTWIENLAVRPSGSIILTEITAPNIYLIEPLSSDPKPTLLYTFPEALSVLGITETTLDTFYVVVSNLSLATVSITPGSNRIFEVSFPLFSNTPKITEVAVVSDAVLLNGMTTLNDDIILAADSELAGVWAINVKTGVSTLVIDIPEMQPDASFPLGINGLHYEALTSTLYFTNTAQLAFYSIPINPSTGAATGSPKKISTPPSPGQYDDFTLTVPLPIIPETAFMVTAGDNTVVQVDTKNGAQEIIAGNLNSTTLAEPTSCAFGRTLFDFGVLYVTTSGGLLVPVEENGEAVSVGGQLVAVSVL
jgi:hypothetical protein